MLACLWGLMLGVVVAPDVSDHDFGSHRLHFNVVHSMVLPATAAHRVGLTRAEDRYVLNLTVLEKRDEQPLPVPVAATRIDAQARNLLGAERKFDLIKVDEGGAVYYVVDFRVADEERLRFKLTVVVDGRDQPMEVEFDRHFDFR